MTRSPLGGPDDGEPLTVREMLALHRQATAGRKPVVYAPEALAPGLRAAADQRFLPIDIEANNHLPRGTAVIVDLDGLEAAQRQALQKMSRMPLRVEVEQTEEDRVRNTYSMIVTQEYRPILSIETP